MKTREELSALKEEVKAVNKKLAELTEEELAQVAGGLIPPLPRADNPFRSIFDGSSKTVDLNIDLNRGPQGYDCSGLID